MADPRLPHSPGVGRRLTKAWRSVRIGLGLKKDDHYLFVPKGAVWSPEQMLQAHVARRTNINEHLQTIHDTVVAHRAQTVVELGVRYGESTIAILCALTKTGGRLYSCDLEDYPRTREMVRNHGLEGRWTFTAADDIEWGKSWKAPIDVLLIDSSHLREHTEKELRLFTPFVRPTGIVLMHDTVSHKDGVMGAIQAFLADHQKWAFENRENNNGLGILRPSAV